jgi:hypothetical protein
MTIVGKGFTILRKSVEKIQVLLLSDGNNCTQHKDQYALFIISHSILLIMRNLYDKFAEK